jgi:hypothetical protein
MNPVPPSSRAGVLRKLSGALGKASDLYERFTGHDAVELGTVKQPVVPEVMVVIGSLDAVQYTTVRDGITEHYIHKFHKKDAPVLCSSPDGSSIWVIGGNYHFTERGIVDQSES